MSKLIGTNPNQVPSNADLGSAAYMNAKDFLTSRGSSLSAIDAVIPNTAVDVFIYDTSLDSDGGAWRKRCQHLSWYNEKLNTTTRGSRREFPAVAVIVAESNKVTIYDGDDPNMPLWMKFNGAAPSHLSATAVTATTALNAIISVSATTNQRFRYFDFLKDRTFDFGDVSGLGTRISDSGLVDRNIYSVVTVYDATQLILSRYVNDVAMTVLPNAPIDSATGLPVPTIAVGCGIAGQPNGGTSIIKHDGTVVDIVAYSGAGGYICRALAFGPNGQLVTTQSYGAGYLFVHIFDKLPDADIPASHTPSGARTYSYSDAITSIRGSVLGEPNLNGMESHGDVVSFALSDKLSLLLDDGATSAKGMVAYTTSTYNTGWMNGDIKLATLSDTEAGYNSKEFITNGYFSNGTTGWSVTSGSSITASGGVATVTSSGTAIWSGAYQGVTGLEVGKTYIATADIITSNNWGSFSFSNGAGSAVKYGSYSAWNSGTTFPLKAKTYFVATSTSAVLTIDSLNTSNATVTQIDNITVREAVVDRSVNAKPLQVFGTIKKTPVAAGADLVAYSGFSASNYLQQPYNSALNFGTGDFCFNMWFNSPNTSVFGTLLHRSASNNGDGAWTGSGNIIQIELNQQNLRLGVWTNEFAGGPTGLIDLDDGTFPNNQWTMLTFLRRNSVLEAYQDGRFRARQNGAAAAIDVSNTNSSLWFGNRPNVGDRPFNGSLALFRVSATAPSADQIKKMYEDEKMLFQENAKATLYGTSDAVTALAYDNSTDLLHVGTSAGRSVFQGLRRVDNTIDAVGTAISAVNGMVVEE